jgi:putative ABC transport system ATP-binding protein
LLNLASGLIVPDSGSVFFDDTDIAVLDEDARTRFRGKNVAFVFQQFHLVPNLTVEENVELALSLNGLKRRFDTEAILGRVGLLGKEKRYPFELSGGEQQRVGIARAFVGDVPYLFMDEPTGNLDKKNADRVMDLIGELRRETEVSILAITHDESVAARADKRFRVGEGKVVEVE